jgi:hypothetical protein
MFLKGSRYRNLPQSSNQTARRDSLLGVDVRFIPPVPGQFLHTVSDRERLDLLAFKYYSDPKRWWLIADANRAQHEFPTDLVDPRPFVDEELAVTSPGLLARTDQLLADLGALGTARLGTLGPTGAPTVDAFSTVVIVQYAAAATRPAIVDRLRAAGYRLTASSAWPDGTGTAEAFSLTDPQLTQAWNDLTATLASMPGVRRVVSLAAAERLLVSYNTALVERATLLRQITRRGFAVVPEDSLPRGRVGSRIVIPPNQAT